MTWNMMLPWYTKCRIKFSKKYLLTSLKPKMLSYFSDSCASQYINQKNLFNLCQHSFEFRISAKWVFFTTFHGKEPCVRIGGTVKRLTRFESLRRATSDQILTPTALSNFCNDNIKGINLIYFSNDEVDATKSKFAKKVRQYKNHSRNKIIPRIYSNNSKWNESYVLQWKPGYMPDS